MEFLQKSKLRKRYSQLRDGISIERQKEAAARIVPRVLEKLQPFSVIASFIPFRSEIDIGQCNQWILKEKQLAIPRISSKTQFRLVFDFSELEQHPLGFYHPIEPSPIAGEIDCILVPGLVFDRKGYRLGYGKGVYDRLLAMWPNAHTIGVAFQEQLVDEVPRAAHDLPVHELVLG